VALVISEVNKLEVNMVNNISIIRKYKRQSRSPFNGDDSTVLLMATIAGSEPLTLRYDRFIYLHRDEVGRWLGISLSNHVADELADDKGKYRCGLDMYYVLFNYQVEIADFLTHFSDEITALFGIDTATWLEVAQSRWSSMLKDANYISDS